MMQNFMLKYLVCTLVLKGWPQMSSSSTWERIRNANSQTPPPSKLKRHSRGGAQQFLL